MKGIILAILSFIVAAILGVIAYKVIGSLSGLGGSVMTLMFAVIGATLVFGILMAMFVLPRVATFFSELIYTGSGGPPEKLSSFEEGMILKSQLKFDQAIAKFELSIEENEDDPRPWMEIANIHADGLDDPHKAVDVLADCVEAREWIINDSASFMFKVADLYVNRLNDKQAGIDVYNQIIDVFNDTYPIQKQARETLFRLGVVR